MFRAALHFSRLRIAARSMSSHPHNTAPYPDGNRSDDESLLQSACLLYGREIPQRLIDAENEIPMGDHGGGGLDTSSLDSGAMERSAIRTAPSTHQWFKAIALVGDHTYAGTWGATQALEALTLMKRSLCPMPSRRNWPHRMLWRDAITLSSTLQRPHDETSHLKILACLTACHVEVLSCAPNGCNEECRMRLVRCAKQSLVHIGAALKNASAARPQPNDTVEMATSMTSTLASLALVIATAAVAIPQCVSLHETESVVTSMLSCIDSSDPALVAIVECAAQEESSVVSDALLAAEWCINITEFYLNKPSPDNLRIFAALLRRSTAREAVWWDRSAVTSTLLLPQDVAPFERTCESMQETLDEAMRLWRNAIVIDGKRSGESHSLLLPSVLIPFLNNTILTYLVRLHEQYSSYGPQGADLRKKVRTTTEEVLSKCGSCIADRVISALCDAEDRCGTAVASPQALIDLLTQFTRLPAAVVASRKGLSLVDTVLSRGQQSVAQRIRRELQEACGELEFASAVHSDSAVVGEGSPYAPLQTLFTASPLIMSRNDAVPSMTREDSVATRTVASWASAVALVQDAMRATTENAPEWRASLPAAIELCAGAGKHVEALQMFDEYLTGIAPPFGNFGSASPSALLHEEPLECMRAIQGAARSMDATGRWYRAIDILTGLSAMEGYSVANQALANSVAKTFALLSHCVRDRWEQSLTLASMVVENGSKELISAVSPHAIRSLVAHETSIITNSSNGAMLWLNAINALMSASDGNDSASNRNACVCLLAAKDPMSAAEVIIKSHHRTDASVAPIPFSTVDDAMRQFAANGAWSAALSVCISHEAAMHVVSPHWDSVAVALQNFRSTSQPGTLTAETITRVVSCIPSKAIGQRSVLRSLYRSAENHGAFRQVAAALRMKSTAEKSPDARKRIEEFASVAEWAAAGGGAVKRSGNEGRLLSLTDPMLVHIRCSSPLATDGTPVAFEWSPAELNVLRRKYKGNVKQYIERELNVPSECLRAKDLRGLSSSASLTSGDRLVLFPKYRPSEHNSVRSVNGSFFRNLIVASRKHFAILTKPPGIRVEELLAKVNDASLFHEKVMPVFQLQADCEGLLVVAPCKAPKVRIASCAMFLLLGLRRISTDGVVHAWETAFFQKYHMTVIRVIPSGEKIESSEVVVVECQCSSDEVNIAGSLYHLTMDLAVEGWGYDGDSGNAFLEEDLDRQSLASKAKPSKHDGEGRRTLYLLREVHVRTLPGGEGDGGGETNGVTAGSLFVAEMDTPSWWFDDGFLPLELALKESNLGDGSAS